MKRYMIFSDHDIFEGLTHKLPGADVEKATQPDPIKHPLADDPAALMVAPSLSKNVSATLITTPAKSKEGFVALVTTPAVLADEPDDTPIPPETTGDVRSPTELEYPKWVKVHLSHTAASVGSIPCNPGDLRWCCGNCSSSQQKRAQHHLEEEQQALRGTSSSSLPGSSLELAPQEEEDLGAKPKVLPLGFQEITKSLTAGKSPEMEVDCPLTEASQDLSVGSTVATVTSTTMCQNQTTGVIYLSTVATSMGLMNLEAPSEMVGHWRPTIEELM